MSITIQSVKKTSLLPRAHKQPAVIDRLEFSRDDCYRYFTSVYRAIMMPGQYIGALPYPINPTMLCGCSVTSVSNSQQIANLIDVHMKNAGGSLSNDSISFLQAYFASRTLHEYVGILRRIRLAYVTLTEVQRLQLGIFIPYIQFEFICERNVNILQTYLIELLDCEHVNVICSTFIVNTCVRIICGGFIQNFNTK